MSSIRFIKGKGWKIWIAGCEMAETSRYTRREVEDYCKRCKVCNLELMKPKRAWLNPDREAKG